MNQPSIAIVGGGIGGLSLAAALDVFGIQSTIFEQSRGFTRVGADINLTPNAVRALDGLGGAVGAAVREQGAQPKYRISRTWDSGEETSRLQMSGVAEEKYGAPQVTLHRADLMSSLQQHLRPEVMEFGKRLQQVDFGERVELEFADGTSHTADVLIGADGIHSTVRTALIGAEHPTFTGVVAYRAVVDAERIAHVPNLDSFTKWWGPNAETQLVVFPLGRGKVFVFATTAAPEWTEESWTTEGSVDELREVYSDFHADARAVLDACDDVLKSALYIRQPMSTWTNGVAALLGDACHPMMPFMAQGAGQAIEDAVVLARCLADGDDVARALAQYEQLRLERTAAIQRGSLENGWLKSAGSADWVYGYDAWGVDLAEPVTH